jgi:hypothetical protein
MESTAHSILKRFVSSRENAEMDRSAEALADLLGIPGEFARYLNAAKGRASGIHVLRTSFQNNIELLIKKTWVEKSDEIIKDRLGKDIGDFIAMGVDGEWTSALPAFVRVCRQMFFLLFGEQSRKPDFHEYAVRIEPKLGLFFWYIAELEKQDPARLREELIEDELLVGMYFIASF